MQKPAVVEGRSRCPLCEFEADRLVAGGRMLGARLVAHADPDVIVLVGPAARDVLVVPRRHLMALSTTSDVSAPALSAVRAVVNVLRSLLGAAGATVEPTHEIGGFGHVSFRVVPTFTDASSEMMLRQVEGMVTCLAGALDSSRRPAVR